jgi:2-polyprenyl-6-methoxyphenol hydroxylase-like FAD-dependent oxidoreductase
MSSIEAKKIVIAGGGPGGLTLARLLQMQGADVSVYERDVDRTSRVQGSALDLHTDSGLAALKEAGLMDAFWTNHRPELNRLRLMNQDAEVLYDHSRNQDGMHRPEIERTPLRNLLLDSLAQGTVTWNRKLEGVAAAEHQVRLDFSDGKSVLADLVIGADGANSRVRALLTPIKPIYAGVTLVEGVIPDAEIAVPEWWALLGGASLMGLGAHKTFGMSTKSDGSVLFYAGLQMPDDRARDLLAAATDAPERTAWFRTYFPEWSRAWEPLFGSATQLTWRPQFVCPPDQHWDATAHATLIGDAAHVMPPYAGEGVNMAMLDALVLSRALGAEADIRAAIYTYQEEMFARMRRTSGETMYNTEMFYALDADRQIVALFKSFASRPAAQEVQASDLPD